MLRVGDSNSLSSLTAVGKSCPAATGFVCIIGAGGLIFNTAVTPAASSHHLLF